MNTNAQEAQQPRRVGLVGVGLMGSGIAQNIVKHGHKLTILDHPGNQPVGALLAAGATAVSDVTALAAEVDVLILCVTGTPQVEAVMLGKDGKGGALASLRPGTVVIDCSTAVPDSTTKVAQAVLAKGGKFLDAPMTRTAKEAAEGRLNLLVGGDAALLEECRPLLSCFAENILHAGPVGAGHGMKLLHNFVSLGTVALIAEAAACAGQHGVAPEMFVEILAKGGGGGVALERLRPYLTAKDTSSLRFSIANASKDLGYYNTMAGDAGAHRDIAAAVLQTLQHAQGLAPEALVPELADLLARR